MHYRISMLIPAKNARQEIAAKRLLRALRTGFPRGGSWLAAHVSDPIVHGWWRQKKNTPKGMRLGKLENDHHILAWVDVEEADELSLASERETSVGKMTDLFRQFFSGDLSEKEIYFNVQPMDVIFQDGLVPIPTRREDS